MEKGHNDDPFDLDPIQKSVIENDEFTNGIVADFGNDPPTLGQGRQARCRLERARQNPAGALR